jgi:hypothetical protein
MTSKRFDYTACIVFLTAMFFLALRPIESFDTFWQLQSGKYIWQTAQFIYQDIFSQAAELSRQEHCWLHDLVLYVFYKALGYAGLSILKALVVAVCAGLLLSWSLNKKVEASFAVAILSVCLFASEPSWLARPQLWTFLFSIILMQLLMLGRDHGWKAWVWLPPLMLLWANLHAGCVFGLVLIGLFAVGELLRVFRFGFDWRYLSRLAAVGLITFGAAFINPYGHRIPLGQLLDHLKQHKVATGDAPLGMLGNMEWLPTTYADMPMFYWIMGVWLITLVWRWRDLDPFELICFVAFSYMGFSQIRHTTLVAMLAGLFLPAALQQVFAKHAWFKRKALWNTLTVLLVVALFTSTLWSGRWGAGLRESEYPIAAADYIQSQKLPRPIYNSYDWGGYLMWRLYPNYLVFVDGRSTSSKHFAAMVQVDTAKEGFEETLAVHGINTIVTRTCYYDSGGPMPLIEALALNPGWQLVFADDKSLIYVRRASENALFLKDSNLPRKTAFETMYAEANRLYDEDNSRDKALLAMAKAAFYLGDFQESLDRYRLYNNKVSGDSDVARMIVKLENMLNR